MSFYLAGGRIEPALKIKILAVFILIIIVILGSALGVHHFHKPVSYGAASQGNSDVPESSPSTTPAPITYNCVQTPAEKQVNVPGWDCPPNPDQTQCDLNNTTLEMENSSTGTATSQQYASYLQTFKQDNCSGEPLPN